MAFYLAMDAGGTNTTCVLAEDERELARTTVGTIKRMRASAEICKANLEEALAALEQASGVKMSEVKQTCIGTAGETVALVAEWIRSEVGARVGGELLLLGDVEIALDAAFPGGRGVLVLAGTGSNVCGRTFDGRLTRAGGWGPAIADQGSGYWLGREGLRQAFFAMDTETPTLLMDAILAAWNVSSLADAVQYAHTLPPPDFSRLSRLVVNCAEQGDEVAISVLRRGGEDLAQLALVVMDRLRRWEEEATGVPSGVMRVAVAGSIMGHVHMLRDAMADALHASDPDIQVLPQPVDPVLGALWRARNQSSSPAQ